MSKRAKLVSVLSATKVLPWLVSHPRWNGVVVLTYHRIGNPSESMLDRAVFSATPDEFDQQVALLQRESEIVRPADIPELIKRPGRYVVLTFDDGYRDNYDLAFPILKARGVPATFFLCTSYLDERTISWWDEVAWLVRTRPRSEIKLEPWLEGPLSIAPPHTEATIQAILARYKSLPTSSAREMIAALRDQAGAPPPDEVTINNLWMTWDMAREMAGSGMEIGGHTVNHPILGRLDEAAQRDEICGGQRRITQELGRPARAFAYPVGSKDAFAAATKRAVAEAGFDFAFSFYGGYVRESDWDPYNIPRAYVAPGTDATTLRAIMAVPQVVISPVRLPSFKRGMANR